MSVGEKEAFVQLRSEKNQLNCRNIACSQYDNFERLEKERNHRCANIQILNRCYYEENSKNNSVTSTGMVKASQRSQEQKEVAVQDATIPSNILNIRENTCICTCKIAVSDSIYKHDQVKKIGYRIWVTYALNKYEKLGQCWSKCN